MNYSEKLKVAGLRYNLETYQDEVNTSRELLQYCILTSLSKSGFFDQTAFLGGTSLRLFRGLDRFSEDLDFSVKTANKNFDFSSYLDFVQKDLYDMGIQAEIKNKSKPDTTVKKAFVKDNSIAQLLDFSWATRKTDTPQKISIKLEVDSNPPEGATFETKIIPFPERQKLTLYDASSSFAGKCHALLTRKYIKGRDWYDYLFYVANNIQPNYKLLTNALKQTGDYKFSEKIISPKNLINSLNNKIESLDMKFITEDMNGFVSFKQMKKISEWDKSIFFNATKKLETLIAKNTRSYSIREADHPSPFD